MNRRRAPLLAMAVCVAAGVSVTAGRAPGDRVAAPLVGERQARIFQQVCAQCHVRPGIGVPVLGDAAEWDERRARGFESMLARTVDGYGSMPPLGTCSFCSEDDLRRLVAFLAGYSALPDAQQAAR